MKKKILIGTILMLCASSFCLAASDFELVQTDKFEGVIVPQEQGRSFYFGGHPATGFWTPGKAIILKAELKLADDLMSKKPERSPQLWQKIANYNRQYMGIVVDGKKKVWMNFFRKSYAKGVDWKNKPVLVDDGGDSFFNVIYDSGTDSFSDLFINGEA